MATDVVRRLPQYELTWPGRHGRIDVYSFDGGERVILMLHLGRRGGTLLVNSHLIAPEGRPFALGWAFAVAQVCDQGYHAIYTD